MVCMESKDAATAVLVHNAPSILKEEGIELSCLWLIFYVTTVPLNQLIFQVAS